MILILSGYDCMRLELWAMKCFNVYFLYHISFCILYRLIFISCLNELYLQQLFLISSLFLINKSIVHRNCKYKQANMNTYFCTWSDKTFNEITVNRALSSLQLHIYSLLFKNSFQISSKNILNITWFWRSFVNP